MVKLTKLKHRKLHESHFYQDADTPFLEYYILHYIIYTYTILFSVLGNRMASCS